VTDVNTPTPNPAPTPAPPGSPAKPRRRGRRIALIVIAGLVVIGVVAGGIVAYLGYRQTQQTTNAARAATEDFMRKLQQGDNTAAYASLCAKSHRHATQKDFDLAVGAKKPTHFTIERTKLLVANDIPTVEVIAGMTYADGLHAQHIFQVIEEDGAWKVCGDPY
jgi:hypothetical protein